jgi:3-mercaptopyruvate sulfurtransferase SseA
LAPKALGKGAAAVGQTSVQQEPWTEAQTVKPAELAKELADTKNTNRPVVVCSGVRVLYEGAHVPGAVYHGAAGKPQGLADLKKWAQGIPRSSNVVVYCGCCPFDRCPNSRPAFEALHAMGFEHLRVLVLPNDFAQDWVEARYPYDKGKG